MEKICPRCKASFECRHDNLMECHCINVRLDARQLKYLADNFDDCLCNSCLKDIGKRI